MNDRWASARRVLCVRLDTIGDVLMTTPAIRACAHAGRHITLLTSHSGAAIARLVPELDDVIAFDAPWMKSARPPSDSTALASMADDLRKRCFDAAVIFTTHSQSPLPAAMLCWQAGIPLRIAHCRENPYLLLTDWVREPETALPIRHEVCRQLELVANAGWKTDNERLSLAVDSTTTMSVRAKLQLAGVDVEQPWLVLHPGATAPSRRYPAEMYAECVRLLAAQGLQVVVTGVEDERQIVEAVAGDIRGVYNATGAFDLGEMAALLSIAPLLIANNTGPVHMAAAFGTPVVDVYALTNPQHTPWMTPSRVLSHDVPCKNCMSSICPEGHHACLRSIPPREIAAAALDLLGERGKRNDSATAGGSRMRSYHSA